MKKIIMFAVCVCVLCGCEPVFAGDTMMVHAIIGEAAGESIFGQTAIACGIRNRPEGLQGVYGKDMTRKPSEKELQRALTALDWASPSVCTLLIRGSDMWCSDVSICAEAWLGVPMVFVVKIGAHSFYRRLTKGKK